MPKRRIGRHPRRLSPAVRAHLRVVREQQPDPTDTPDTRLLDAIFPDGWRLSETEGRGPSPDVNPYAPVFGDTWVAGVDHSCASCPRWIRNGDEVTMIDGEPNCAACTEEARRG